MMKLLPLSLLEKSLFRRRRVFFNILSVKVAIKTGYVMEGDSSNENLHFIQLQVSIGSVDAVTKWFTQVPRIDNDLHSCETIEK